MLREAHRNSALPYTSHAAAAASPSCHQPASPHPPTPILTPSSPHCLKPSSEDIPQPLYEWLGQACQSNRKMQGQNYQTGQCTCYSASNKVGTIGREKKKTKQKLSGIQTAG